MAATPPTATLLLVITVSLFSSSSCSPNSPFNPSPSPTHYSRYYYDKNNHPMLPLIFFIFFFTLSLISFCLLLFSIYTKVHSNNNNTSTPIKNTEDGSADTNITPQKISSLSPVDNKTNSKSQHQESGAGESQPTRLAHSLLLEILPANSPKWEALFGCTNNGNDPSDGNDNNNASHSQDGEKRKKKKRGKKKRVGDSNNGEAVEEKSGENVNVNTNMRKEKEELVCLYPFTTSSSATQRKIKQQYDQLVKSHESNALTLVQVGQFVNCLIEARNDLQHKSEIIQRKFTITKALLFKADRSSFDRLRQQIYKLELEQKRLEEDAFVYNWLQQQLKMSPAYKKMIEIGSCMDSKAKSGELMDSADTEFDDISFEELLAQEKKDSFWQKNGKHKTCSG